MSKMLLMQRFPLAWAFLQALEEPRNNLLAAYVDQLDRWRRPGAARPYWMPETDIPSIFVFDGGDYYNIDG